MSLTIYGIKNCDTMKKARAWLDTAGKAYAFHDYKTAGIDSDRLYPLYLQQEIAAGIATCPGLEVVHSPYGHDGFLLEFEAVGQLVEEALAAAGLPTSNGSGLQQIGRASCRERV